jgi:hypothetical protein
MLVFLGGASALTSSRAGLGAGGLETFSAGRGLAAQAKEMQRFFSTGGCATGSVARWASAVLAVANETNPILGSRGLGELVRAGVVMPVSHVDAKLVLLVMERRR